MLIRARMTEYGLMRIEYEEAKQRALGKIDVHNSWCKLFTAVTQQGI